MAAILQIYFEILLDQKANLLELVGSIGVTYQ